MARVKYEGNKSGVDYTDAIVLGKDDAGNVTEALAKGAEGDVPDHLLRGLRENYILTPVTDGSGKTS